MSSKDRPPSTLLRSKRKRKSLPLPIHLRLNGRRHDLLRTSIQPGLERRGASRQRQQRRDPPNILRQIHQLGSRLSFACSSNGSDLGRVLDHHRLQHRYILDLGYQLPRGGVYTLKLQVGVLRLWYVLVAYSCYEYYQ